MTQYVDELYAEEEDGRVVVKSWVYEEGAWVYRVLTLDEIKRVCRCE